MKDDFGFGSSNHGFDETEVAQGQGEDKQNAARARTFLVTIFDDKQAFHKQEVELTLTQMGERVRITDGPHQGETPPLGTGKVRRQTQR